MRWMWIGVLGLPACGPLDQAQGTSSIAQATSNVVGSAVETESEDGGGADVKDTADGGSAGGQDRDDGGDSSGGGDDGGDRQEPDGGQ